MSRFYIGNFCLHNSQWWQMSKKGLDKEKKNLTPTDKAGKINGKVLLSFLLAIAARKI